MGITHHVMYLHAIMSHLLLETYDTNYTSFHRRLRHCCSVNTCSDGVRHKNDGIRYDMILRLNPHGKCSVTYHNYFE
jgi:hypothetical protein